MFTTKNALMRSMSPAVMPTYAELPEQHRFQVPAGCHWSDLQKKSTNVGQAIQRSMREIEKANPNTLYGIFGDVQWTYKERLPDSLLVKLVDHFSGMSLSNALVPNERVGKCVRVSH